MLQRFWSLSQLFEFCGKIVSAATCKIMLWEKIHEELSTKSITAESNGLVNAMLFNGSVEFRKNILDKFKTNNISATCKTDNLITGVGVLLYEKHASSQNNLIRQTMRQLGRFIIQDKCDEFKNKNLTYFINPVHFDVIIYGVKQLCEAQNKYMEKTEYGVPSLALKMGHTLSKCVSFKKL